MARGSVRDRAAPAESSPDLAELGLDDPAGAEPPSVLAMVAAVAIVVALTILLFFAVGYVLGRVLL
jgi:hypothetical protein